MTKDYKRRPGACEFCRVKKFRCDGGLPQCERCEIMQKECLYLPCKKRGRRSKCVQTFAIDAISDTSEDWAQFLTPFSGSTTPLTWLDPTSSQSVNKDIESLMTLCNTQSSTGLGMSPLTHARNDSVLLADGFDMCDDISAQVLQCVPRSLPSEMAQDPTDTVLGFLSSDESFIQPTSGTWNLDTCEQSNHDEISSLPHHEPALSPSAFSYQDTLRNVIHSRKLEGLLDDELETTIEKAWSSWSTPEGRRSAGVQRAVLLDYTGAKSALHALCNSPFRGARCINHATLAKMAEEVLEDHNCHAKRIITVHAAIATGIILEQAENSCEERRTIALAHYRHAFAHVGHLQGNKSSILAFQAIVLLLTAAMHLSRADVDQLLDNACARAQALAIHFRPSHSSAHNEVHDDADTDELRNIFWLLYSIEKPARMEAGYISALNDNLINAELPSNLSHPFEDSDYEFLTHIGLSQICSQMLEKLYSQTGSCASQVSLAEEIHVVLTNVANWTQEARQVRMHNPASLSCSTTWTLYLLLLNVYSRSLVLSPTSITLQSAEQAVSDMTSEILDSLIHKDPLTVHEDADFLRAALTAFCISASSFRKAPDSTAQLRQLGFALGFFARLDPDFEFPWRECGSVLRLLQKGSTAHMHTR